MKEKEKEFNLRYKGNPYGLKEKEFKTKLVYYRTATSSLLYLIPLSILKKNKRFWGLLLKEIKKRKSGYDKKIKITIEIMKNGRKRI